MGTSVAVTVLLLWVTWYVLVVVQAFVPRTILPVPATVIIFAPLSVVYGAPKWHRCENRLLHAGTLRRRVHPPHLHPRHTAKARRGRTDNGQLHGTGHVTSDAEAKDHRAGYSARWSLPISIPLCVWNQPHYIQETSSKIFKRFKMQLLSARQCNFCVV